MTRQYPTVKLELEAREQRARNWFYIGVYLIGSVLGAAALGVVAWLAAWLMFFGGAL